MSNLFSLCSPENPCGNHGIWMRGDRVALSFAREGAPANWTGLGTILREAE